MKNYIDPNDVEIMSDNDTHSIQKAIDFAHKTGVNKVVISKQNKRTKENIWVIAETLLLPSDIHIVLDGCHIKSECKKTENIFRNKNLFGTFGCLKHGEQENVVISGENDAVIEGSSEQLILFHNMRSVVIENITFINHGINCISMSYCHNVRIKDVNFRNENKDAKQLSIVIRRGCHQMIFDGLDCLSGKHMILFKSCKEGNEFLVFEQSPEIYGIAVCNIKADGLCEKSISIEADGRAYNIMRKESEKSKIGICSGNKDEQHNIFNISLA